MDPYYLKIDESMINTIILQSDLLVKNAMEVKSHLPELLCDMIRLGIEK